MLHGEAKVFKPAKLYQAELKSTTHYRGYPGQRQGLLSSHGEPGTRLRVRETPTAGAPAERVVAEGATGYPFMGVPVNINVSVINSSHGEREGEAPTAWPVEGAT